MTLNRGIALSLLVGAAAGFAPLKVHHPTSQYSFELSMAPRFDPTEQKWYPSSDEDGQSAGYPPIGSLFRQGPKCFFTRIFTPDQYEQSVLKYMSQESCSRNEAQGNMDAYLENPNDWFYQKSAEKKGSAKYDYANANMDPKQIILSAIWAAIVIRVGGQIVAEILSGKYWN